MNSYWMMTLALGLSMAALCALVSGSVSADSPADHPLAVELAKNCGFENKSEGWTINDKLMAVDSTTAHSGEASLRISWDTAAKRQLAFQIIPVKPGKRYEISAWLKCQGARGSKRGAMFGLEWSGGGAYPAGVLGDCDWTPIRCLSTIVPDATTGASLFFTLDWGTTGTAWIDDISVREVDSKPLVKMTVETPSVVGEKDSPPFRIVIETISKDLLGEDAIVDIALCSPPWNTPLIERRAEVGTIELPTAELPEGVYKLTCVLKSTKSGRALAEPDGYTLYKRPPMQCLLIPHSEVVLPETKSVSIDVMPYRNGTLSGTVADAKGRTIGLIESIALDSGQRTQLAVPGKFTPGKYRIDLVLETSGAPAYRSRLSFTALTEQEVKRGVVIKEDNSLAYKGKPWFPMLVYADTAWDPKAGKEIERRDPVLTKDLLDHLEGTPLGLMDYGTPMGGLQDTVDLANECAKRGIKLALSVKDLYPSSANYAIRAKGFPNQSPEQMVKLLVATLKNHPALALYYTNDELSTRFYPALKKMREWVHEEDPLHPTLHVHYDLECIRELSPTFDMFGPELYPSSNSLRQMADWSRTTVSRLPKTAPFWGCIFHFTNDPNGSAKVRADAYLAIACGARGLLFYSYNDLITDKNFDQRWKDITTLATEIETRTPLLMQPEAPGFCKSENPGIVLRTVSGKLGTWLIAVNSDDVAVDADIRVPAEVAGASEDKTQLVVSNGSIKTRFEPFQVKFIRLEKSGH